MGVTLKRLTWWCQGPSDCREGKKKGRIKTPDQVKTTKGNQAVAIQKPLKE